MAVTIATSQGSAVVVRAPRPGDGPALAHLWRQLWDLHTSWGGYPGSDDAEDYARVAERIDRDAYLRDGSFALGQHLHLVACIEGAVVGQVEGWLERYGARSATPTTCEVRSLVVDEHIRGRRVGAELLRVLAREARYLAGRPTVLVAEVFEANPAQSFYAREGYTPLFYTTILQERVANERLATARLRARTAGAFDAVPIAFLEGVLAERRRQLGDLRFDGPMPVDATFIGAIAAHLTSTRDAPTEVVAIDAQQGVRAAASVNVMNLDPPFKLQRRAVLGRFAEDPALPRGSSLVPLIAAGYALASARGARAMEITDLDGPGAPMYEAAVAAGARPWSRVVSRFAS